LLKIKIKTKRKPLPLTQPAIHLTKPMVSSFSPLIAGHFLISMHILRPSPAVVDIYSSSLFVENKSQNPAPAVV
jgi:hypothetical protein